ncbi:MAG: DUF924 family protein [Alphaproteobacteria bacterium]
MTANANIATAEQVLHFWFEELEWSDWFTKSDKLDARIASRFEATVRAARDTADLDDWARTADGALALCLVLDQFPRNIWRDRPDAFSGDDKALKIASSAIDQGFDRNMSAQQRCFFYLPFEHSEDLDMQDRSIALFTDLGHEMYLDYAIKHRDIIARFGRFPHRNRILGRETTAEEAAFLKTPGSSF